MIRLKKILDDLGIRYHEELDGRLVMEVLGIEVNGETGVLRPSTRRAWRLHAGTSFLLKMKRGAGWQVQSLV